MRMCLIAGIIILILVIVIPAGECHLNPSHLSRALELTLGECSRRYAEISPGP